MAVCDLFENCIEALELEGGKHDTSFMYKENRNYNKEWN